MPSIIGSEGPRISWTVCPRMPVTHSYELSATRWPRSGLSASALKLQKEWNATRAVGGSAGIELSRDADRPSVRLVLLRCGRTRDQKRNCKRAGPADSGVVRS